MFWINNRIDLPVCGLDCIWRGQTLSLEKNVYSMKRWMNLVMTAISRFCTKSNCALTINYWHFKAALSESVHFIYTKELEKRPVFVLYVHNFIFRSSSFCLLVLIALISRTLNTNAYFNPYYLIKWPETTTGPRYYYLRLMLTWEIVIKWVSAP